MSKAGCEVNEEGGLVPLPSLHAVEACRLLGFKPDGDVGKFVIVAALEDVAISVEPRDRRSFSVPEPESPQLRIRKEACFDDCKQALAPDAFGDRGRPPASGRRARTNSLRK